MSNKTTKDAPEEGAISETRRRLLQAAATAAPLIATLPNGAAAATASTAQCIKSSVDAHPSDVSTSTDSFVRQSGKRFTYTRNSPSTTITVYSIDPNATTLYRPNGNVFNPEGWTLVGGSEQNVYLLRVFKPIPTAIDPASATSVTNCNNNTIPPACIYPVNRVNTLNGNQGLATSCLCSVNPTLVTGACKLP